MKRLKLPVGIENFQEIRQADFYYVDKTRLIEQLIDQISFHTVSALDTLEFAGSEVVYGEKK